MRSAALVERSLARAWWLLLLVGAGCECAPQVTPIGASFTISPATQVVDFGRVAQGQVVRKKVTVVAEARAPVALTLRTQTPFSAPASAQLPASESIDVTVTFTAGNGAVESELVVTGDNGQERRATLRGTGVAVQVCVASDPCTQSTFSIEQGACVESPKPEDAPCTPLSRCLTDGRCRGGQCLGVARSCDDNNACTLDGCAEDAGCINTDITCPGASERCEVGVCDPQRGCGVSPAPDNQPCGPVDCVHINLCRAGRCTEFPTPDGVICGQKVACVGEARCRQQRCERPDAGPYAPKFTTPLSGNLTSPLRSADGTLYFSACGVIRTLEDGGRDGPLCALVSYTGGGFLRFATPLQDGGGGLIGVGARGALLQEAGALVLRRLSDDGIAWAVPLPGALEAVAVDSAGAAWLALSAPADAGPLDAGTDGGAPDGGEADAGAQDAGPDLLALARVVDGGLSWVQLPARPLALAADRRGGVWAATESALVLLEDGGVSRVLGVPGGARGLAVSEDLLWLDGAWLLRPRGLDGGVTLLPLPLTDDAGVAVRHQPRPTLLGAGKALTTYRRCRSLQMSCLPAAEEIWARVVDGITGAVDYDALLVPALVDGALLETTLLTALPGAFAAVATGGSDGGAVAALQLVFGDERRLLCPLPPTSADVRAAHFAGDTLFVVVGLPDGGARLEGYPLHSLTAASAGWPTADGRGGLHREE